MSIKDSIKNAGLSSSPSLFYPDNEPTQYTGSRRHMFYENNTAEFNYQYAEYASDYVVADIQGLDSSEPESWLRLYVRLADLVKESASMSNNFDDYKFILIAALAPAPEMDANNQVPDGRYFLNFSKSVRVMGMISKRAVYIKRGTKVMTMGSTWLAVNPANMSDGSKTVIQRCNATWRYHDYYGNVCYEPICVYPTKMRANDPDAQRSSMITKGYFDARAQYNDATKQLRTNSRMILGSSAYMVSGYSDFNQEFTDDDSSVNIVEFSLRYDEPNDAKDDMVNRIADGKLFSWEIFLTGKPTMEAGDTATFTASSKRNGNTVTSTTEYPINYLWSSSNEAVATVSSSGVVTAVSEGTATITATLKQNENKTETFSISVEGTMSTTRVVFESTVPETLSIFDTATISAGYYEDGSRTSDPVTWKLGGADSDAYTYTLNADNSITIKCWSGSVASLSVTASHGTYTDTAYIELRGI